MFAGHTVGQCVGYAKVERWTAEGVTTHVLVTLLPCSSANSCNDTFLISKFEYSRWLTRVSMYHVSCEIVTVTTIRCAWMHVPVCALIACERVMSALK